MNIQKITAALAIALILGAGIVAVGRITGVHAADADFAMVSQKLDQVLANQRSIMDSISSMRGELNIIKVRITQAQ